MEPGKSDAIRLLHGFPTDSASADDQRSPTQLNDNSDEMEIVRKKAVDTVWSQINSKTADPYSLTDSNVHVFENVKRFCRDAHSRRNLDQIPVGVLLRGSLVPCNEVDPLRLLAEILKTAEFNVVFITADSVQCFSELIETAMNQLTGGRCGETEIYIHNLLNWCGTHASMPTVILIDNVEAIDPGILADVVDTLVEELPTIVITLLMGLSSDTQIDRFLLSSLRSSVASKSFPLMSPRQCFDSILKKMLLSAHCPTIVAGPKVMTALNNLYLYHHFTIAAFKQSLRQALLDHINLCYFGPLLPCVTSDIARGGSEVLIDMPDVFWINLSEEQKESLPERMQDALEDISGWKVTILWLHSIAELVGAVTRGGGHSLREIYFDALHSQFKDTYKIPKVLEWANEEGGIEDKGEKLLKTVTQLNQMTEEFEGCNPELKAVSKRLIAFIMRLELAQSREMSGRELCGDRSNPDSRAQSTRFHRIIQQLDELTAEMFEKHCSTPPDQKRGSEIFYLFSDYSMNKHLCAAPRREIPNLLLSDSQQQSGTDSDLFRDSAAVYDLCLGSTEDEANVFEVFSLFTERHGVFVSIGQYQATDADLENFLNASDSDDGLQNHCPEVKELRIRFEWAVRLLEEQGLISRQMHDDNFVLKLQILNE